MKSKTLIMAAMAISTIFLLASCGTTSTDTVSHGMDDGSSMEGTKESMSGAETENAKENASSGQVDEESVVGDGKTEEMHPMDDGSTMSGTEESMNEGNKME